MKRTLDPDAMASEALQLAAAISPLLEGRHPEVVGATLAQLVAMLHAGHFADTRKATDRLREDLFDEFTKTVFKLIPPLEEELLERKGINPHG